VFQATPGTTYGEKFFMITARNLLPKARNRELMAVRIPFTANAGNGRLIEALEKSSTLQRLV
jgi:hypothetical protein